MPPRCWHAPTPSWISATAAGDLKAFVVNVQIKILVFIYLHILVICWGVCGKGSKCFFSLSVNRFRIHWSRSITDLDVLLPRQAFVNDFLWHLKLHFPSFQIWTDFALTHFKGDVCNFFQIDLWILSSRRKQSKTCLFAEKLDISWFIKNNLH